MAVIFGAVVDYLLSKYFTFNGHLMTLVEQFKFIHMKDVYHMDDCLQTHIDLTGVI